MANACTAVRVAGFVSSVTRGGREKETSVDVEEEDWVVLREGVSEKSWSRTSMSLADGGEGGGG